jgi:hypothetical protein
VEVVKHAAALKVWGGVFQQVLANALEQRVAGGDPFEGGVFLEELFIKHHLFVFAAQFAEAGFEPFADGPELAGNAANAVDVGTG